MADRTSWTMTDRQILCFCPILGRTGQNPIGLSACPANSPRSKDSPWGLRARLRVLVAKIILFKKGEKL